jgi:hypothetical protein
MISLAKALKIKNRLAGKLAQLQTVVKVNNSIPNGEKRTVSFEEAFKGMNETRDELVRLKGLIGAATAPISGKLAALSEAKNFLTFYGSIVIREQTDQKVSGYGAAQSVQTVTYTNHISEADRKAATDKIQAEIERLQDEIDEFNAVTKIEFN